MDDVLKEDNERKIELIISEVETEADTENGQSTEPSRLERIQKVVHVTDPSVHEQTSEDENTEDEEEEYENDDGPEFYEETHYTKEMCFKGKPIWIVTEIENRPSPLITVFNALLLRGLIVLPDLMPLKTSKIVEEIRKFFASRTLKRKKGDVKDPMERIEEALSFLPKLTGSLNLDIIFSCVTKFEAKPTFFQILPIRLLHGFILDPQNQTVCEAANQISFKQLVKKVKGLKNSNDETAEMEGLLVENYIDNNPSQLTEQGLSDLKSTMEDGEVALLFYDGKLKIIYKRRNKLFMLKTERAYHGSTNALWKTIVINGESEIVDSNFCTVPNKPADLAPSDDSTTGSPASVQLTVKQQFDNDFLVAMSVQVDEQEQSAGVEEGAGKDMASTSTGYNITTQQLVDMELARQLQQEEDREAAEAEEN